MQSLEVLLYKKIKNLLEVLELRKIIPYCLILTLLVFLAVDRLCSRKGVVKVETMGTDDLTIIISLKP